MKKITLLLLLLITGFTGFSQPWDFNNSDDGFAPNNGNTTAVNNPTFVQLTFVSGTNGRFENAAVSVDATNVANAVVAITVRNNSATGPTELRFQYLKQGGGYKTHAIVISQSDAGFKTYYADLTHAEWTGTVTEIRLQFKNAGNLTFTGTGETLDIDKMEFLAAIPTTLRESYLFDTDGDAEGFNPSNATISGPAGGILTVTPDPNKFPKITQILHHVDATANKYVHVTLINNSTANDQIRFNSPATGTITMPMLVSGAGGEVEKTYTFDLSGQAGWTGTQTAFFIGIGSIDGADGLPDAGPDGIPGNGDDPAVQDGGKSIDSSPILINSIEVNTTLSVGDIERDDAQITLYPNPVNNILRINSPLRVEKVEVFNLLGQKTMTTTSNTVDASGLSKGMYIVKIYQENDVVSTKRFIKQ